MDEADTAMCKMIGKSMYAIEVEQPKTKGADATFELIRIRGGNMNSGGIAVGPVDPNFNSKHPDFVRVCVQLGLADQLLEAVKKYYR